MSGHRASGRLRAAEGLERARELHWYHTLQLGPGGPVTEGEVDLRPHVERYGLPERMDRMRSLDVGSFDGFWAFEMERRGAEVVAIDVASDDELDRPAVRRHEPHSTQRRGETFRLARELLDSRVQRETVSIYDATPERLGTFDLVLCGSLLIHVRDPVLALERIAALCRGRLVCAEPYHRLLSLVPLALAHYRALRPKGTVFWEPNVRAWRRMLESAGFQAVEEHARFNLRSRHGWSVRHVVFHAQAPP